jgi:NTE family protein
MELMARLPWTRRRLAAVLSGGGMMGAFQAGVVDTVASGGIAPDLIVGTSIGALNGAFWAFHPGAEVGSKLNEIWRRWPREVMPSRRLALLRQIIAWPGYLLGTHGLVRMIDQEFGPDARVEDAAVPLAIVAADAATGERVVIRSGPLKPALLASTAVPGVFPPVKVEGRLLIDGGIVANADLDAAHEGGATDILAIDLSGATSRPGPNDLPSLLEQAVSLSLAAQTNLRLRALPRRLRVAVLRPLLERRPTLTDATQAERLFDLGRTAGRGFLAAHWTPAGGVRPGSYVFSEADAREVPREQAPAELSAQPAAGS